jgi:hypothetical protein
MGKNCGRSYFHFGSRWRHLPKGWSKIVFLPLLRKYPTFFQSVFCISFVLSARKFEIEKKLDTSEVMAAELGKNPKTQPFLLGLWVFWVFPYVFGFSGMGFWVNGFLGFSILKIL